MAKKEYRFIGRVFDGFEGEGDAAVRKRFTTGDVVKLTDEQYAAFSDQFEASNEQKQASKVVAAPATAPGTAKVS